MESTVSLEPCISYVICQGTYFINHTGLSGSVTSDWVSGREATRAWPRVTELSLEENSLELRQHYTDIILGKQIFTSKPEKQNKQTTPCYCRENCTSGVCHVLTSQFRPDAAVGCLWRLILQVPKQHTLIKEGQARVWVGLILNCLECPLGRVWMFRSCQQVPDKVIQACPLTTYPWTGSQGSKTVEPLLLIRSHSSTCT